MVEGVRELLSAPTDIRRPPPQLHLGFGRDEGPGLVHSLAIHEHVTGHDQLGCLLPALHQTALNDHSIDPDPARHRP